MKSQASSPLNPKRQTLLHSRVFVGLSGGVDSSVSAALLKDQGFDVTGVFIKVWTPPFIECTWKEDRLDAMRVCAKLGITFMTLDLEKEYKEEVVDYMIREYKAGKTPNPDVMCNKEVKFGAFYDWARKQGADFVATGHYAQVKGSVERLGSSEEKRKSALYPNPYTLTASVDENKDQSYFLWNLKQEQLTHVLFPIGHLLKPEVRKLAEKYDLITADKKDSQGLCFLGKIDMKDFLKHFIAEKKGNVLDIKGKIIGKHEGAVFYTIGERHGFSIEKKTSHDKPLYIVAKNIKANTLTVSEKPAEEETFSKMKEVLLKDVSWTGTVPKKGSAVSVRMRYRQELVSARVKEVKAGLATITFDTPQSLVTSGQSLVIYNGEVLLGGGIIA